MKKVISILLVFAFCLSLCACGKKTDNNNSTEATDALSTEVSDALSTEAQDNQQLNAVNLTKENTIEIEGKKLALPIPAETLMDYGWTIPAMSEKLDAQTGAQFFFELDINGETKIKNASFYNHSTSETTLDKCNVISLTLLGKSVESSKYVSCSFVLPNGITEKSTYQDVVDAFGTKEQPKEGYSTIYDNYDAEKEGTDIFEKYGFDYMVYADKKSENPYNYVFRFNADKTIKEVEVESINYRSAAVSTMENALQ